MAAARRVPDRGQLRWHLRRIPANRAWQPVAAGVARSRIAWCFFRKARFGCRARVLQILERCDGQRTFGQIIAELQAQFSVADPAKIRAGYQPVSGAVAA